MIDFFDYLIKRLIPIRLDTLDYFDTTSETSAVSEYFRAKIVFNGSFCVE